MPILVDIIALAFLAIRFKGLLVLASKIPNGITGQAWRAAFFLQSFFCFNFLRDAKKTLHTVLFTLLILNSSLVLVHGP